MRLQTAPTGPGEDMELPKYFLKLHGTAPGNLKKKIQKVRKSDNLSKTIVELRGHSQTIPNALIVLEGATGNQQSPMLQKECHKLKVCATNM